MFLEYSVVNALLLTVSGYLLGSLSAAIITCKVLSLPDPRSTGSNNPGATNVLRLGGKKAAAITLLGDMSKGLIAVLLARLLTELEGSRCGVQPVFRLSDDGTNDIRQLRCG